MSEREDEFVSLGLVNLERQTDKAYLVTLGDGHQEVWVPISVVEEDCDIDPDDLFELCVKSWFAEREGLS